MVRFKTALILSFFLGFSQSDLRAQEVLIAHDYMEEYDWFGNWQNNTNFTGFSDLASVSPTLSCVQIGNGGGNSGIESNWYVLPNLAIDPSKDHVFRFRLASYRMYSSNNTRGADLGDFIQVQLSTDGGLSYTPEITITGNNNAYWDYNTAGIVSKVANGTNSSYSPSAGGNRTAKGDGFSVIELYLPAGTSQVAIDIYTRVNASGEEWWMDNMELFAIDANPLPVEMLSYDVESSSIGIQISWATSSENNSDYFIIERSESGDFHDKEIVGSKTAAGNSDTRINYNIVDNKFINGINYYRIIQVDKYGKTAIYGPLAIDNSAKNKVLIKTLNTIGQEVDPLTAHGIIFEMFSDGSINQTYK